MRWSDLHFGKSPLAALRRRLKGEEEGELLKDNCHRPVGEARASVRAPEVGIEGSTEEEKALVVGELRGRRNPGDCWLLIW